MKVKNLNLIALVFCLSACSMTSEFDEKFHQVRDSLPEYDARMNLDELKEHKGRKAFAYVHTAQGSAWGYAYGYTSTSRAEEKALAFCQQKALSLGGEKECEVIIKH
jgi:hypothetical protein